MSRARSLANLANSGVFSANASTSRVGINSTAPTKTLDVVGDGRVSGTLSIGGTINYEDVTSIDSIGVVTARDGVHIVSAGASIYSPANNELALYTNGSERVRVTSDGSVGIGNSSPVSSLSVTGNIHSTSDQFQGENAGIFFSGWNDYGAGVYGRNSGNDLVMNAGSSEKVRVRSSGRIGVNTTADTAQLNIHRATSFASNYLISASSNIGNPGSEKFHVKGDGTTFATQLGVGTVGSTSTLLSIGVADSDGDILDRSRTGDFCINAGERGIGGVGSTIRIGVGSTGFIGIHTNDIGGHIAIGTQTNSDLTGYNATVVRITAPSYSSNANIFGAGLIISGGERSGKMESGGQLAFQGSDGSVNRTWGAIFGHKDNSTVGNYAGHLAFLARRNGSTLAERMRLTGDGKVGVGTTAPLSSAYGSIHIESSSLSGDSHTPYAAQHKKAFIRNAFISQSSGYSYARMDFCGGRGGADYFANQSITDSSAYHYLISYGHGHAQEGEFAIKNGIGDLTFYTRTSRDSPQKRVGIASDASKITIYGGAAVDRTIRFEDTHTTAASNDNVGQIEFYSNDSTGARVVSSIVCNYVNSDGDANIKFRTTNSSAAATDRMKIGSSGNVIVMESMRVGSDGTPSATLHVDGDLLSNDLILSNLEKDTPNEVDGTRGHWCIQEGAEDLFIINRQTGKKYKFNLSEVQ